MKKRFFPVICAYCAVSLTVILAGCSNPIYNTPGALDPDEVVAIAVTPPTKRLYYRGENLDLADASVNIYYRGPGVKPKLNQKIQGQVSGFNSKKEGIQTVTVTIEGRSDSFDIALLLPLTTEDGKMSIPQGQAKTISNPSGGAWNVYIFESVSRAIVKVNGKDAVSGKSGDIVFTAPAAAGEYIIAISISNIPRFYTLTVS